MTITELGALGEFCWGDSGGCDVGLSGIPNPAVEVCHPCGYAIPVARLVLNPKKPCSKQPHLSWQYASHIFRHSLHPPDAEALGAFYFIVMTGRKCDGNVCSGIPGIDQTIVRDSRRGI